MSKGALAARLRMRQSFASLWQELASWALMSDYASMNLRCIAAKSSTLLSMQTAPGTGQEEVLSVMEKIQAEVLALKHMVDLIVHVEGCIGGSMVDTSLRLSWGV